MQGVEEDPCRQSKFGLKNLKTVVLCSDGGFNLSDS